MASNNPTVPVSNPAFDILSSLTAPLDRLQGALDRLAAPLASLPSILERLIDTVRQISRGNGSAGSGLELETLAGPIRKAASLESLVTDSVVAFGQAGEAARTLTKDLSSFYNEQALKTGQSSMNLALAGRVMAEGKVDYLAIREILPSLGTAATAAGGDIVILSQAATALNTRFAVTPAEMDRVIASLYAMGRSGGVGIERMAREIPRLLTDAGKLGLKGSSGTLALGAALQVSRKETASDSSATDNLQAFLRSLHDPDAQKNYARLGVDVGAVVAEATRTGGNPIVAVLERIQGKMAGLDPQQQNEFLAEAVKNPGARAFIDAGLKNFDLLKGLPNESGNSSRLKDDHATQSGTISGQIGTIIELKDQIIARLGVGFSNLLSIPQFMMSKSNSIISDIDRNSPDSINAALSISVFLAVLTTLLGKIGLMSHMLNGVLDLSKKYIGESKSPSSRRGPNLQQRTIEFAKNTWEWPSRQFDKISSATDRFFMKYMRNFTINLAAFRNNILTKGPSIIIPLASRLGPLFFGILSGLMTVMISVIGFVLTPIGLVVAAIGILALLVYLFWDKIKSTAKSVINKIRSFFRLSTDDEDESENKNKEKNALETAGDIGKTDFSIKGVNIPKFDPSAMQIPEIPNTNPSYLKIASLQTEGMLTTDGENTGDEKFIEGTGVSAFDPTLAAPPVAVPDTRIFVTVRAEPGTSAVVRTHPGSPRHVFVDPGETLQPQGGY